MSGQEVQLGERGQGPVQQAGQPGDGDRRAQAEHPQGEGGRDHRHRGPGRGQGRGHKQDLPQV